MSFHLIHADLLREDSVLHPLEALPRSGTRERVISVGIRAKRGEARMPTIRLSRFCVLIVILEFKSVRVSYYGDNSAHVAFSFSQLSQVIANFFHAFSRET